MENSGLIYLVRHCATENDEKNYPVMLGQKLEARLSDAGREYARNLGDFFVGKRIDAVYASPLARAVQTAQMLNRRVAAPMMFCSSLLEADMGSWEGLTYDEVMFEYVSQFAANLRDPGTYGYPEGENLSQVCRRSLAFIEKLAEKHHDQRIVLVTHKYVNRAVLAHLMGVPFQRAREIDQDPGCVNVIRVFRGVMELQQVNFTSNFNLVDEEDVSCDLPLTTPVVSE